MKYITIYNFLIFYNKLTEIFIVKTHKSKNIK